jgi:hypothetical protein
MKLVAKAEVVPTGLRGIGANLNETCISAW